MSDNPIRQAILALLTTADGARDVFEDTNGILQFAAEFEGRSAVRVAIAYGPLADELEQAIEKHCDEEPTP